MGDAPIPKGPKSQGHDSESRPLDDPQPGGQEHEPEHADGLHPDAAAQLQSEHELQSAWETWKSGDVVHCVADGSSIALSVEATVATYRFVCTHCGNASPWFQATPAGLRLRLNLTDSSTQTGYRTP